MRVGFFTTLRTESAIVSAKKIKYGPLFDQAIIRFLVGLFGVGLLLPLVASTNMTFLTKSDYQRMLTALEKSPDVVIPKGDEIFVDGERPTYLFVCSVCGRQTRYWRQGIVDWEHIEDVRKIVEDIRGLRCDAHLDDTWLCQHCHPERFALERRPVSVVLKKGLQKVPNYTGCQRYVPKEIELSVKSFSSHHAYYWLVTKRPYTIVERSAIDAENRLIRDVYASSFITVRTMGHHFQKIPYQMQLPETQGVGHRLDEVQRSLFKGMKVEVEDIPPLDVDFLTATNDLPKYCLVTTPDHEMGHYWGSLVRLMDVKDVRYEEGVDGFFSPVFLSVSGGPKLCVSYTDLSALRTFLAGKKLRHCQLKSYIPWFRKLLLPKTSVDAHIDESLTKSYIYPERQCREKSASRCPEFAEAIRRGALQRMDWTIVSNLVVGTQNTAGEGVRVRQRALRAIEAMEQAAALFQRHTADVGFRCRSMSYYPVLFANMEGILFQSGSSEDYFVSWAEFFFKHTSSARELFSACVQREWPNLQPDDRPYLPQLGFALLLKYIVPDAPSSSDIYKNDVLSIRERYHVSRSVLDDVALLFPELSK